MSSSSKNKIILCIAGLAVSFILSSLFFMYYLHRESSYIPERNAILRNMNDENLSDLLINNRISNNPIVVKISIKIMKFLGYKAKLGEYALPHHVSLFEAIRIMDSGKGVMHKITIPEGFSVFQIMKRLGNNENLLGTVDHIPLEGSLMPDTYCFQYPTTRQNIISTAQKAMREFLKSEWPQRSPRCTLRHPEEALILASIVEKETNTEKEMIAGVYLKRLKIRMRLQSCPTVIYAHKRGDKLGHNLKYSELTIDDPYNTYAHGGLPPTPISNPGRSSIIAVLHPEETENLFFVFDGIKKHIFSKTYAEHKRNIAKIHHLNILKTR